MVHPSGYVIFAELKAEKGVTSPEQRKWGTVLLDASRGIYKRTEANGLRPMVDYHLWKPSAGNTIAAVLSFGKVLQWTP